MKQLSVVVQHLLEVRHLPTLIHRVAVKATPQLIVNSTSGHSLESKHHRIPEARTSAAPIGPKHHLEIHRVREFGRAPESAILAVYVPLHQLSRPARLLGGYVSWLPPESTP